MVTGESFACPIPTLAGLPEVVLTSCGIFFLAFSPCRNCFQIYLSYMIFLVLFSHHGSSPKNKSYACKGGGGGGSEGAK